MTLRVHQPELLSHLVYEPDFLDPEENVELAAFLASVPTIPIDDYDPRAAFAYTRPRYDGVEIASRKEAAAGSPISFGGAPVSGVPMPPPLAQLAERVGVALAGLEAHGGPPAPLSFTSVYVDWYEAGGFFVPHVDRDSYGPVIAGVSVGVGEAALEFLRAGESEAVGRLIVEPRSLYAFFGPIRYVPWEHRASDTTGRRFSITFRMPAMA
jgi:hypothetical protein